MKAMKGSAGQTGTVTIRKIVLKKRLSQKLRAASFSFIWPVIAPDITKHGVLFSAICTCYGEHHQLILIFLLVFICFSFLCYFFHKIMGNCYQSKLCSYFFLTSKHKSSEALILFYVSKDCFYIFCTLFSVCYPLLAC